MALESPQTYAEWYWKHSIDADTYIRDEDEKILSPIISNLINNVPNIDKLPTYIQSFITNFTQPTSKAMAMPMERSIAAVIEGIGNRILNHEIKEFDYAMNSYLQNARMTPEVADVLRFRRKITDELWTERQLSGAFNESEALAKYETTKPFPSLPDLITFGRYHDVPDNPKELVWKMVDISPIDWELWNWLSYLKLNTEQVTTLFKRKYWTDERATLEWARLGWPSEERNALIELSYALPNPMLQVQGLLLQDASKETILNDIQKCDIHPAYTETYLDGILTKPSTMDIIAYELRKDPSLANLDKELRRIGVHSKYFDTYKTLAYPIPPVQDIITMAVREAFSPEIASRFGQYEDLPPEFVTYAEQKGLSREWAERYWASHWNLPSPQQGFEMLHRGIIGRDDLMLLLRALDIMPYWRNKLIEVAYRPLTRIDVRRMFRVGVLDEAAILKAYKDLGYNEDNAKYMTQFSVRETRATLSGFRANDVIQSYTKHFIDSGRARALLREIGTKDTEVDYVLRTADYKREWFLKQERIDAVSNLYRKGKYTDAETRTLLSNLGLPSNYVQTLIEQWQLKTEAEKEATWSSAQTLKFYKLGLITEARAREEFNLLGYNAERINIYIASVSSST